MKLASLFKKTKTGATQQYDVETENNVIYVTQGQVAGEKQVYTTVISEGKNIGKSNETTPTQQAESEARSKHAKKIKSGYSTSPTGENTKRLPQKVKKYQDLFKSAKTQEALELPCFVEPKLNGINFTTRLEDELTSWSRGGEPRETPAHQVDPLTDIMTHFKISELNTEQYCHGMHLQDIQSATTKANDDTPSMIAYIFEIPSSPLTYREKLPLKYAIMDYIVKKGYQNAVQVIIPKEVETLDAIEVLYIQCMSMAFEGVIVTNSRSVYKHNTRSSNVWKYKIAQDAEFLILSYAIDKNGHPVFTCRVNENDTFDVKPKGTDEERKAIIDNFDRDYKNKWYKSEFEMYSKDNIPLKPVGIGLRKCDDNGKPLE